MRVYLPLTLPALRAAHRAGELAAPAAPDAPGGLTGYAVTPGLRAWLDSEDAEELEYTALEQAALASLRQLAADVGAARRRVVLAVDAADARVAPADTGAEAEPGEVRLAGAVRLAKAAAVH